MQIEDLFQEGNITIDNLVDKEEPRKVCLLKFLDPVVSAGPADIYLPNICFSISI